MRWMLVYRYWTRTTRWTTRARGCLSQPGTTSRSWTNSPTSTASWRHSSSTRVTGMSGTHRQSRRQESSQVALLHWMALNLWRPLLPYGYSYKAFCARLGWAVICNFWHLGTLTLRDERHAQGWASECPDVKNYKWRLNPVWHRMLYSCTRYPCENSGHRRVNMWSLWQNGMSVHTLCQ